MIEKTFIEQGIKRSQLEEYLRKELEKAGFTKSDVVKTPLVTRIIVNVTRPGLAIGKSGQNIRQLTEMIESKFKIENPQIEIKEITEPNLDAIAVVNKVKALIERGYSWRSVAYKASHDIMSAGAQGVDLVLAGKLTGKGGRKRKQRIAEGYMKKVGFQSSWVDMAKATAYPKPGAIGIKVRIVRPGIVFPDKIDVKKLLEDRKAKEEEKKADSVEEKTAEKKVEETSEQKKAEKKEIKEPEEKEAGEKKKAEKTGKHEEKKAGKKEEKQEEAEEHHKKAEKAENKSFSTETGKGKQKKVEAKVIAAKEKKGVKEHKGGK
ncbi:MAG: small subunit ribosomal protein S3 [archaeon GW2011_AR10]|uniref:30S ribosomal protein S3 n=1 Tax=Candidatus Iainarchaeum sp. TaxID=3101447 RepID=A0A7J4IU23_9ARCH|nr:MAG: small subunit ribosomal protein S3 [archaeon GW2011_AR10]AJS11757.1 30S ribosomal protein S3P [uncultured archaeon]HIH08330.1 30S ribosomal protein S3 [Candidatus Diapherotrites archaeon]